MTLHEEGLERIIQEYVPGKQLSLAHIIASPTEELYEKLGIKQQKGAIGIITVTPAESAIIAGDQALKAASVRIGFIDRFSGSVFISGSIDDIRSSIQTVIDYFQNNLDFSTADITKS